MIRLITNIIGFQCGWFACILGAAHGMPALGPAVVAAVVAVHLALHPKRRTEALAIGVIAIVGAAVDIILHIAGVLRFGDSGSPVPLAFIPWIIALWVNFAATVDLSLGWLRRSLPLAVAFGAIGGPLTYATGERLGAIGLAGADPHLTALAIIAIEWAVALPLALRLSEVMHDRVLTTREGLAHAAP